MSSIDSLTTISNRQDFDTSLTYEADSDQAAATLLTPTSGKTLSIKGIYINTEATSGGIRIYTELSNDTLARTFAANTPCTGYIPLYKKLARNEKLKYTSTLGADQNYFIQVNYKEF